MADSQRKTANLAPISEFTNNIVDTRAFLRITIRLYNGSAIIGDEAYNVTETGTFSYKSIFTTATPITRVYIKHDGTSRDIPILDVNVDYPKGQFQFTADYQSINPQTVGGIKLKNIMLNYGSTPLPYDPYSSTGWYHSLRKLTTATEAVKNPLYSDGTAITSYTIKGNTEQDGTPTQSNPVDVQGVGELDSGQYKIPISNGQQTTNIYLGSTQTVRAIEKYTFTGNETTFSCVATTDGQNYCVAFRFDQFGMTNIKDYDKNMGDIDYPIFVSSHFAEKSDTKIAFNDIQAGQVGANTNSGQNGNRYIVFCVSGLTTAAEYSAWFAQQYANGTPIEVYYILETPTTATVNEPLMKIGNYADTLSNAASIPTTEGDNSITVDTTVPPSEFTATWTGWHNATVKEWDGSAWS